MPPSKGSKIRAVFIKKFRFLCSPFGGYGRRTALLQVYFLPNPNTPQSPTATAPLLKRGEPIAVRLRCEKRNCGENLLNQKNGKVTESAKQQLLAAFPSRGLLSSRSRVTPSSRRKAHGNAAALPQKKSVRIWGFEALDFSLHLQFFQNRNTPQSAERLTAPLLKRGQPVAVRLQCQKAKAQNSVLKTGFCAYFMFESQKITLPLWICRGRLPLLAHWRAARRRYR